MNLRHYVLGFTLLLGSSVNAWANDVLHCEARGQQRVECAANIAEQDVVMLQREWGQNACRYRENWGYYPAGVWVRDGCQATFMIQHRERNDNAAVRNQPRQVQGSPEVVRDNNSYYRNRQDQDNNNRRHDDDDNDSHRNRHHKHADQANVYRDYPNTQYDERDRYDQRYDNDRYQHDNNDYQQRRWQEPNYTQNRGQALRNGQSCLSASPSNDFSQSGRVFASNCQNGGDRWQFTQGRLQHQSGQCLALASYGKHAQAPRVVLAPCAAVAEQQWTWFGQLLQNSQGYCLGASGKRNGQHVFLTPCNQTDSLRWYWD